jgi:hypothetical protein
MICETSDQFTPGPWEVGEWPDGHCRIYAPWSGEGHAIARTYGTKLNGIGVCRLTGPENEADAILIAAAPAMLYALRRLTRVVPHVLRDHPELLAAIGPVMKQAHQTIENATLVPERCRKW